MSVRVRFAPSPTGYLHVGGARTALFNWLFARHHGGTFVLRIEDTDLVRSTEESVQAILQSMTWLGLDWDEGPGVGGPYAPYFQTERLDTYRKYAEKLIEMGRAYYCYCSPEELEERRAAHLARGEAPKYDRKCCSLTAEERAAFEAEGRVPVVRFRALDDGDTLVDDLVKGRVSFENSALDDFIMIKSDGVPTYNFAAVIDDALMEITHIIRGDDHLSNTPRQIQVYQALGFPLPKFAHIPMILGPDKTRLSKRHGATSVTQYRDSGYLPEAMLNYLALLGWSLNATETLFSQEQLIKYFTLERCSKNPAVFDTKKLEWMNGVYIRKAEVPRIADLAVPYLQEAGLLPATPSDADLDLTRQVVALQQTRLKTVGEIVETSDYFFRRPSDFEEAALANLALPHAAKALELLGSRLADANVSWEPGPLEEAFKGVWEELGLTTGELIHPVRSALTGKKVSPGIYDVLIVLGREESLARLSAGVEVAKKAATAGQ